MAMVLNRCLIGAFMARLMDESKFLQNNPRLGIHPQETVDLGKPIENIEAEVKNSRVSICFNSFPRTSMIYY